MYVCDGATCEGAVCVCVCICEGGACGELASEGEECKIATCER